MRQHTLAPASISPPLAQRIAGVATSPVTMPEVVFDANVKRSKEAAAGGTREFIRRAELVAALSRATDLSIGQPMEFAMKSCALSVRLADALGFGEKDRREAYYQALLRYIGCNAETDAMAALFGDEIELRRALAPLDPAAPADLVPVLARAIFDAQAGKPLSSALWGFIKGMAVSKSRTVDGFRAHCETAQRFARHLGFEEAIVQNLDQFSERWDGKGLPNGVKGEAIPLAVRVVTLAQDAIVLLGSVGLGATVATIAKRSGSVYDPRLAAIFVAKAHEVTADLEAQSSWDALLTLEPEPQQWLSEPEFDEALLALADFTDIKSSFTFGHSRAVAALAAEAGRVACLPNADVVLLRRAGLLHDIGQVAISSGLFAKAGALTDSEREKIRLHPYHTERILARPAALSQPGHVAARHHERVDGSGYHSGARGGDLSPLSKILAAAEMYRALTEERAYRPAFSAEQAKVTLNREVNEGRLDAEAVAWVLEAAGHHVPPVRRALTAGLTARELEVLRLVAYGKTVKEIGGTLGISFKTADNHIQNLYAKIGVRTRAGATLFAIEHGLAEPIRPEISKK
jgi:HD-GYP domain-containing protein (c-di-GMP phosphodiesterase class II)